MLAIAFDMGVNTIVLVVGALAIMFYLVRITNKLEVVRTDVNSNTTKMLDEIADLRKENQQLAAALAKADEKAEGVETAQNVKDSKEKTDDAPTLEITVEEQKLDVQGKNLK